MQNDVFCIATRRTTFHKKRQKTINKSSQNPLKLVVGGLQNVPPKNDHKKSQQKSQKCRKSMILGTPNFREITGVGRTFRHFFGFGRLWGSPGAQNGPKTSPKPSQDPSKPRFLMIFDRFWGRFLIDFLIFFVSFFEYFRCSLDAPTTQNAEHRTQVARWRGLPAGQFDI